MICDGFEKRIAIEKLITVDVNKEIKIYNIIWHFHEKKIKTY